MLPLVARGPPKQVDRAWLDQLLRAFPALARLAAEAEPRGRHERDAGDVTEHRPVLMPADRRAGAVLDHRDLLQRFGLESAKSFRDLADGTQEVGDGIGALELLLVEVVAPAVGNRAAFTLEAAELERLKWKIVDALL